MHIPSILEYLYPGREEAWEVYDLGQGAYIAKWTLPDPQPTKVKLQKTWDSPEFQAWYKERQEEVIDIRIAQAIRKSIHPHVPVDEHFAILREQIANMLRDSGQQGNEKFQAWCDIAKAEIAKGREKKDTLKE